ncbi:hypothetical protein [Edaphobacter modestus]|nr:hypothetical protein [Edaphobacter modestus]
MLLAVHVEHPEPEKREMPKAERFYVAVEDSNGHMFDLYAGDSFDKVPEIIRSVRAAHGQSAAVETEPLEGRALMEAIAEKFQMQGIYAKLWHSGGNLWTVLFPMSGKYYVAGDSLETWGADVYADADLNQFLDGQSVETSLPSTETDPAKVVATLLEAINHATK